MCLRKSFCMPCQSCSIPLYTRWFKYDRDLCGLFTHKSVPVIFEPPCTLLFCTLIFKFSLEDEEQKTFHIKCSYLIQYVTLKSAGYTHQKQVLIIAFPLFGLSLCSIRNLWLFGKLLGRLIFIGLLWLVFIIRVTKNVNWLLTVLQDTFCFLHGVGEEVGRCWEAGYRKWLNLSGERFSLSFGQLAQITVLGGSAFCSYVCISVTVVESL
jgi:hypothetical protein